MRRQLIIGLLVVLAAGSVVFLRGSAPEGKRFIINTKHDFRATSSASIHAASSKGTVCIFCHTPHNAASGPMIWNQKLSSRDFPTYASSTM